MRRVAVCGGGLAAALLFAASLHAEPPPVPPAAPAAPAPAGDGATATTPAPAPAEAWETAKAERRYGFTMGIATGLGVGLASGYPNQYGKMGNPSYRARTSGVGAPAVFWLGGALADWFSFGLGGEVGSFGSSKLSSSGGAFVFHIEAFPFYGKGGGWRDLGVLADFGAGSATIVRRADGTELASSGAMSVAGAGVFWEPWRFVGDHIAAGPVALWQYQDSDAMARHLVLVGIRAAYYGGPGAAPTP